MPVEAGLSSISKSSGSESATALKRRTSTEFCGRLEPPQEARHSRASRENSRDRSLIGSRLFRGIPRILKHSGSAPPRGIVRQTLTSLMAAATPPEAARPGLLGGAVVLALVLVLAYQLAYWTWVFMSPP